MLIAKNSKLENKEYTISLERISKVIRNSGQFNFETFVLENLNEESDKILFNEIWRKANQFKNWNYSDISIGGKKTTEIIRSHYKLDDEVINIIVNQSGYNWK